MPLKSKRTYINGILNNYLEIKNNNNEIPFNIYVYQMPDIIVKSNTTMEEYYMRQQLKGLLEPFYAHYYVGKRTIWSVAPAQHKILKVGICGNNSRSYLNTIKLLIFLSKKYTIGLNQIFFSFKNEEFFEIFKEEAQKHEIKEIKLEIKEEKEIIPQVYYKVLINNNWQIPDDQHYINGLQIKCNVGIINYRIHYYNREWSKWVGNNEKIYSNDAYADGFQLEFIDDKYQLEFTVLLEGRGKINWRSKSQFSPYGKLIKSIDFRLRKKEGD